MAELQGGGRLGTRYGRSNPPADQASRLTQLEATCGDLVASQTWPSTKRAYELTDIPTATLDRSPFREIRAAACRLFRERYPDHPQSVRAAKKEAARKNPQSEADDGELKHALKQCRKLAEGIRSRDATIKRLNSEIAELKRRLAGVEAPAHPPRPPRV